ncbi:helix-turn-helix domain-containing protein [Arthrobacter psychrolactophilus]
MDFVIPTRLSNRHHFTTAQKLAVLDEYDKCLEHGSKSELARAVGIGSRTLSGWFNDREAGILSSRSDSIKGNDVPEYQRMTVSDKKLLKQLQKENDALRAKLAKSEAAVDILGKASALLAAMAESATATDPVMEELEPGRPAWLTPKHSDPSL